MSDRPARARRGFRVLVLMLAAVPACAARAEPAIRVLDLPFKVREMRGPGSEAAISVATSGLLPIARAGTNKGTGKGAGIQAGDEAGAPVALVWGDEGGAVLTLDPPEGGGSVAARPIGREAVEGLTAAETPRGALPGTRRALAGPLSAYLTGRARSPDGGPAAAVLTLRERQPVAVAADPRPVPVSTATVPAGDGTVFAPLRPRALLLSGRPAVLAATLVRAASGGAEAGGLALIAHPGGDPAAWVVTARSAPQPGGPLKIAGIADFSGSGTPQAATVSAHGTLQVWTLGPERIEPSGEAAGYAAGEGDAELAAVLGTAGAPEIALPAAGGAELVVVGLKGTPRERLRVPLPATAATGVVALGSGAGARVLVGLSDGRVAVVAPDGGRP